MNQQIGRQSQDRTRFSFMKKATNLLLSLRKNAELVLVESLNYKAAKSNKCFQNAAYFCESRNGFAIVSGWLVGDDFGSKGTVLIPHYWVKEIEKNKYFDTTPKNKEDTQSYEYVLDLDIFRYGTATSYLPPPVFIFPDNKLKVRLNQNNYIPLNGIDVEELYSLRRAQAN